MFNGRHVNYEASRQGDVRGDARALLSQRLFGDLDDDFLAFFEEIGNRRQRRPLAFRFLDALSPFASVGTFAAF